MEIIGGIGRSKYAALQAEDSPESGWLDASLRSAKK
jgi:hypothetical protein